MLWWFLNASKGDCTATDVTKALMPAFGVWPSPAMAMATGMCGSLHLPAWGRGHGCAER